MQAIMNMNTQKLKIGDKVKVKTLPHLNKQVIGKIGIILTIEYDATIWVVFKDLEGVRWFRSSSLINMKKNYQYSFSFMQE